MNEKLTLNELQYVQEEVKTKGKKLSLAYLITFFVGIFGIHMAYFEKPKIAIIRGIITILAASSYIPVRNVVEQADAYGITMELQQHSSTILVIYGIVAIIAVLWYVYDLLALPKMVKIFNKKIEVEVSQKVIEARNVEGQLKEEEASKEVIEKVLKIVNDRVNQDLQVESNKVQEELDAIKNSLESRKQDVLKLVREIDGKIEDTRKMFSEKDSEDVSTVEPLNKLKDELDKSDIDESIEISTEINNEEIVDIKELEENINTETSEEIIVQEEVVFEELVDVKETEDKIEFEKISIPSEENTVIKDEVETEEKIEEIPTLEETEEKLEFEETKEIQMEQSIEKEEVAQPKQLNKNLKSISEVLKIKKGKITTEGYIVGFMNGTKNRIVINDFEADTNLVIAEDPQEIAIKKCVIVKLDDKNLKKNFGLMSNPSLIGQKVVVSGVINSYFNEKGIKNVTNIELKK